MEVTRYDNLDFQSEIPFRPGGSVSSLKGHRHATDEWLTPRHIIDAVQLVMGRIDLDPCSNSAEQPHVPAKRHFTREDNGLEQEWVGAVFQHHPFSQGNAWVNKALQEIGTGRAEQVIILDAASTGAKRFHLLAGFPVAFVQGYITFTNGVSPLPDGRLTRAFHLFFLRLDMKPADYSRFRVAFAPFCSVYGGADL